MAVRFVWHCLINDSVTKLIVSTILSSASNDASSTSDALVTAPLAVMEENMPGLEDFDFLMGDWHVQHRRLTERLAGSHVWMEFEGTMTARKVLGNYANIDENLLNMPGGAYHAITLRAFDKKTGQWSIWWLDGRTPNASLEPAMRGGFRDTVGTFYADDTFNGSPIRVRFVWSHSSPMSCRWEQSFSLDNGITWETNWVMKLDRVQAKRA